MNSDGTLTKKEIQELSSPERVAGYLTKMAIVAYVGARLRVRYQGDDEKWTENEENEWQSVVDDADPWFQSLSPDELKAISEYDSQVLAPLCRGEWPLPKPISAIPDIIKRECKACGKMDYLTENTCAECK